MNELRIHKSSWLTTGLTARRFICGCGVLLLLAMASCSAQSVQPKAVRLTTYTDTADGVTLQYPSVWTRTGHPYAYCPPVAFGSKEQPIIPVTFGVAFTGKGNYYENTSMDALVFSFGTKRNISQHECTKIAKVVVPTNPTDSRPVSRPDWLSNQFDYGRGGSCSAGHSIDAQVFTRFMDNRCYIFEEDFDEAPATESTRQLSQAEHTALMRHLDGIIQSVKFSSVMLPKSWTTTTFNDPKTGVSFEYPAALRPSKDVDGYIPAALAQMEGLTWHAKLAYDPPTDPKVEEADTDFGKLTFLFATKLMPSESSCNKLAGDQQRQENPIRHLNIAGVPFIAADVSDAGLSHSLNGTLYVTYRSGTCFLFEEDFSSLDGYAGDLTDSQVREIEQHMNAIAPTIRFAQTQK